MRWQFGQSVAFFFFSAHLAAFADDVLEEFPVTVAVAVGLLVRIAFVSFSIASLLAFIKASTCFECRSVSSATSSSVACAISSTTLFADACPVALAVVVSCRFSLENSAHMTTFRLVYVCAATGLDSHSRMAGSKSPASLKLLRA